MGNYTYMHACVCVYLHSCVCTCVGISEWMNVDKNGGDKKEGDKKEGTVN